jgi:hypothetical protein
VTISRRDFVRSVAGAAASTFACVPPTGWVLAAEGSRCGLACALLDLESQCVLRESLRGYQAALPEAQYGRGDWVELPSPCRTVIVPGLGILDGSAAIRVARLLTAGTTVILESGAAFLSPSKFALARERLNKYFGIEIEEPVTLRAKELSTNSHSTHKLNRNSADVWDHRPHIPYVSYLWPRQMMIRDFSRAVPVSAPAGRIIGTIGPLPIAMKTSIEKGTLIFLGSPIGPSLLAGDTEAQVWLRSVINLDGADRSTLSGQQRPGTRVRMRLNDSAGFAGATSPA